MAAGASVLAAVVLAGGGFEVVWFGHLIRVHDPTRPLGLASLAGAAAAWANGSARSWAAVRDALIALDDRLLLIAFVVLPVGWGLASGTTVGAISSAALVVATYWLGRALGSSRLGVMAAWLVAMSPTPFLAEVTAPAGVAAAAAWAWSWSAAFSGGMMSAAGAGAVLSVAVLRVELAPVAGVMLLAIGWQTLAHPPAPSQRFRGVVYLSAVAVQGAVVAGALNLQRHGSALVFDGVDLARASFLPNLQAYARSFAELYTPILFLGAAAVMLPLKALWPEATTSRRALVAGIGVLGVGVIGCLRTSAPTWQELQLFLPAWPFLMLGAAAIARWAMRSGPPPVRLLAVWLIAAIGVRALLAGYGRGLFAGPSP